jgi:Zn-dependent protease with chaperone function
VPFQVPFVGVLGCWRPKVIVTRATRSLLNAEELRLVLRHEKSHIMRRDNVRLLAARLVALLTFNLKSWQQMEALRSSQTEFVADSAAVTDEGSALCLAQALVKMARGYPATHYRFASSFAAGTGAIQERVLRLLSAPEAQAISHPQRLFALAGVAALAALLLIAFQHSVQYFCYQTLEKLVSL